MEKVIVQVISSIVATYGFGLVFNVKGKILIYASICGGLGWFVCSIFTALKFSDLIAYSAATSVITVYSEIFSRRLKVSSSAFLFPSLVPLVPGGGVYFTMYYLIKDNISGAIAKGFETLMISGAIAIGILTVSTFSLVYSRLKQVKYFNHRI